MFPFADDGGLNQFWSKETFIYNCFASSKNVVSLIKIRESYQNNHPNDYPRLNTDDHINIAGIFNFIEKWI